MSTTQNASLWRRSGSVPQFSNSGHAITDLGRDERLKALEPRRPYIPVGCDQQGRLVPTRLQRQHADFVDTIPTGPMPLGDCGAAHAAGALDDGKEARIGEGAGVILWPLAGAALLIFVFVPLVVHVAARWLP